MKQYTIFLLALTVLLLADVDMAFADTPRIDSNIVSDIVSEFKEHTDRWFGMVQGAAKDIFILVIYFEFLWVSTKAVIQQVSMKDYLSNLVLIILTGIFTNVVISNYEAWSQSAMFGLQKFAGDLTPFNASSDNPFIVASKFYDLIEKKIDGLGIMSSAGLIIGLLISGFIITICFSLITAKMIVIKCEALVGVLASLLLIPLGASQMFKDHAIAAIKYAFAIGFKLFTLQLIIAVGYAFMDKLATEFNPSLHNIFMVIAFSLILLCLVFYLPEYVASLVSTVHGSAGSILQSINTVSNTATAIAASAMALGSSPMKTFDTSRAVAGAINVARNSMGSSSFWSNAKNVSSAYLGIRDQAKMNRSTIRNEFINADRQLKELRMA